MVRYCGGFRGGGWAGAPLGGAAAAAAEATPPAHDCDTPHLPMTYTALATLLTLGDDLSRVREASVRNGVSAVAHGDGSFAAATVGCERDLRFVFCACAVSAFLGDFGGIDAGLALGHIGRCQAYDGGLGLAPGGESHGGSTYCGIAARALLLKSVGQAASGPTPYADDLDWDHAVEWCARRHTGDGVVGRTNKPPDSCYAYWVGAALRCLGATHLAADTEQFVLSCENKKMGGFAKYPEDTPPDLLHAFYSICSLSWTHTNGLRPVDPTTGICEDRLPPGF